MPASPSRRPWSAPSTSACRLAPQLVGLARRVHERYGQLKRERSCLDNDDLVTCARRRRVHPRGGARVRRAVPSGHDRRVSGYRREAAAACLAALRRGPATWLRWATPSSPSTASVAATSRSSGRAAAACPRRPAWRWTSTTAATPTCWRWSSACAGMPACWTTFSGSPATGAGRAPMRRASRRARSHPGYASRSPRGRRPSSRAPRSRRSWPTAWPPTTGWGSRQAAWRCCWDHGQGGALPRRTARTRAACGGHGRLVLLDHG